MTGPEHSRKISIALREGEGNPVALRLDKVWALAAMQNVQGATDEIDVITRLPDLQGYEANVLLWQGELEWNCTRIARENHGIDPLGARTGFRAGTDRDKKYAEADREYAEGLAAETVDLAVKHFRKAIEKVKSHHRANRMLGLLLILTGSIQEARRSSPSPSSCFRTTRPSRSWRHGRPLPRTSYRQPGTDWASWPVHLPIAAGRS